MDKAPTEDFSGDLTTCLGQRAHTCQGTVFACPHKHAPDDEQGSTYAITEWLGEAAQDPGYQSSQDRSARRSSQVRRDYLVVEE